MKRLKIYLLLLIMPWGITFVAQGQDILFSQFYAAPLYLNPALTGVFAGDLQLITNYRNNSNGLIPYNTTAASADMKIKPLFFRPDIVAAGVLTTIDNVGNGSVKYFSTMVSGAYHKAITEDGRHYIGVGVQTGYIQSTANPNDFSYDEQYVMNQGYDPSSSNNENFTHEKTWNVDLNAGLFWSSNFGKSTSIYSGVSAFHITKPRASFSDDEVGNFPRRYIVHGGFKTLISEDVYIVPNYLMMFQNKNMQIMEGASVVWIITQNDVRNTFDLGMWYRHSDNALIFSTGIRYKDFRFKVSSDFVSEVQLLSKNRGAFEFSLVYTTSLSKLAKLDANPRNRY